jgi:hypothetical protein
MKLLKIWHKGVVITRVIIGGSTTYLVGSQDHRFRTVESAKHFIDSKRGKRGRPVTKSSWLS